MTETSSADPGFEMLLPRPVEAVWLAFRDPEIIRRWHGWDFDGLDEEIKALYVDGVVVDQENHTLHIGGHLFAFSPQDGQTLLRVSRKAPVEKVDTGIDWLLQYADIEEGWISFLQQLRFMLSRQLQRRRRTVFRAGATRSAVPSPIADVLGLFNAARTPAGEPYVADVGPGDHLEGEIWFRTGLQLGVTVDSWGEGLLILTHPASAGEPFGLATMILTTYGLSDEAFEDLERRWGKWFAARYEED